MNRAIFKFLAFAGSVFAFCALPAFGVATWTGAAGDNDITNAANWQDGTVPFSGTKFTANWELAADADWSAATLSSLASKTGDLKGHSLTVASIGGSTSSAGGTITDSTTDTANPGRLVANVASGKTWNNTYVALTGNLKLVKEGAGTFVGKKTNQTYTGGTEVNAGTVKSTANESSHYYGPDGSVVTVHAGGTLDIAGKLYWNVHSIVLDGGTLANTGGSQTTYTSNGIGNVTLTADSTLSLKYNTLFNDADGATLDLGGYTLTVVREGTTSSIYCTFNGTYTVTGGTVASGVGIRLQIRQTGVDLSGADLVVNGTWVHNATTFRVRNLEENMTGSEGTGVAEVTGRFKTNGNFDNVRLVDGATLDLRDKTAAFSLVSAIKDSLSVSFGEGTVTIDISGRSPKKGDKIVAWSTIPEGVTFKWDDETAAAGVPLLTSADGIFYGSDSGSTTVNTAYWTGSSGGDQPLDPRNWDCYNLAGEVVVNGLPTNELARIFITQPLSENLDWRALGVPTTFGDGTVDLNGYTLTIRGLSEHCGAVAIKDGGEDEKGELVLASGTSKYTSGMTTDEGLCVRVLGGATLDLNGVSRSTFRAILEDGARIENTGSVIDTDKTPAIGGGLALVPGATATIHLSSRVQLRAKNNGVYPIALNGGTLVKEHEKLGIVNADITGPGTIRVTDPDGVKASSPEFNIGNAGVRIADDVVIEVAGDGSYTWLQGEATVPTILGDGKVGGSSYYYTITRRFSGLLAVEGKGTKFASGMTIDLTKNAAAYAVPAKVTMAENATIMLDLAGRADLGDGKQIVSWQASTEPSETTRFTVIGAPYVVLRKDDGLYLLKAEGLVIGVR